MGLFTATPKNAEQLMARLSTTERIAIRGCTPGALEHMRQTSLAGDMISAEELQKVYDACVAQLSDPAYTRFPS